MYIPPWTILAGFGSLARRELSDLVAVFEDTTLFNVVAGRLKDLTVRRGEQDHADADAAFEQRLKETSDGVFESDRSDAVLRLQLWHKTREAFDLEAAIPLATRDGEPARRRGRPTRRRRTSRLDYPRGRRRRGGPG